MSKILDEAKKYCSDFSEEKTKLTVLLMKKINLLPVFAGPLILYFLFVYL